MNANYNNGLYKDYEELITKYDDLSAENKILKKEHRLLQQEIRLRAELEEKVTEKNNEIDALKKEILRLNGMLNIDGNNSGTPTSKTPISKNKRIPNSREKTGKSVGGQPGHVQKKLESFSEKEITEHIEHPIDSCPECGATMERLEEETIKDELDYEVVVVKKRHHFNSYKCLECGAVYRSTIPVELKEENQYGAGVKSLMLLLMNIGNVSVNKVQKMIYGLSQQELNPSEGYIIKQQKKAGKMLVEFQTEIASEIRKQELVYWDDTVIMISTARACLRFYGTEKLALYKAHLHKNKEGIDHDNILTLLGAETKVMHDHNLVNYNKAYSFVNVECNAHLLRDIQRISENLPDREWLPALKKLINETLEKRRDLIDEGYEEFEEKETSDFFTSLNHILLDGMEANKEDDSYYGNEERKLINRITDYKDNYFAWVVNFDIPFTNNLSERSLRGAKSKMKIAGQFQSEEYAIYYASIKSYIETCYRNGINEYHALERLCYGNPYTVKEILEYSSEN